MGQAWRDPWGWVLGQQMPVQGTCQSSATGQAPDQQGQCLAQPGQPASPGQRKVSRRPSQERGNETPAVTLTPSRQAHKYLLDK